MHRKSTLVCRSCLHVLPRSAFDPSFDKQGRGHGVHLRCRSCRRRPRERSVASLKPMLRCRRCHLDLPRDHFDRRYNARGNPHGWFPSCRQCRLGDSLSLTERLWSLVQKTPECWLFDGPLNDAGYGRFRWRGKRWFAHRVAFTSTYGPVTDGVFICHHCDNPRCVRPDHLFAGSHDDNMRDMARKGRHHNCAGERHAMAKLTAEQVSAIRRCYLAGLVTQATLAKEYGVAISTISMIVRRASWSHIA